MMVPIWATTVILLTAIGIMVNGKTKPAAVTTDRHHHDLQFDAQQVLPKPASMGRRAERHSHGGDGRRERPSLDEQNDDEDHR